MNSNESITVIDFGTSKIRLAIFNKFLKKIYSQSAKISSINDDDENYFNLKEFIKKSEKNISQHINNLIILFDTKNLLTIDICYKKNLNDIYFIKKNYYEIENEVLKFIEKNYPDYKIIDVVRSSLTLDGIEIDEFPNKKKVKSLLVELKILCTNKKSHDDIINKFKSENLNVINLFFTSFLKSRYYSKQFEKDNILFFLDIGWEKSSLNIILNEKLLYCKNIPIGGNHITKDISKIFKIDLQSAENLKLSFFETNEEFSFNSKNSTSNFNLIREINSKQISIDTLKKVILARSEEIINLSFSEFELIKKIFKINTSKLILMGDGSKLFNQNHFHLENKFNFSEICYYDEMDDEICSLGAKYFLELKNKTIENPKKSGIFEKFFNLFNSS